MEEQLEKYAEPYNEVVEELPEEERGGAGRDRDESYANFEDWTRRARAKVWHHTQESPPRNHGPARSHLQRVPLPYFSGKAEEWPEFRRYFLELTENEHGGEKRRAGRLEDQGLEGPQEVLQAGQPRTGHRRQARPP